MSTELKIPEVGESVREVQIGRWLKSEGDSVQQDEDVLELETDKASMELTAPITGVLAKIVKREGETVAIGEVVAYFEQDGAADKQQGKAGQAAPGNRRTQAGDQDGKSKRGKAQEQPSAKKTAATDRGKTDKQDSEEVATEEETIAVTPAARRALREHGLAAEDIESAGGRIGLEDVQRHVRRLKRAAPDEKQEKSAQQEQPALQDAPNDDQQSAEALEELVPMSLIRRRIGERLVEAQQQAALLTTFNEVDMSAVKQLRQEHQKSFHEKYDIKLGYMSFFVKAVVEALKQQPELNAEIRDGQILYRNYYHIGVAIGSERGLVVPVLKFAERRSFAEIELAIDHFVARAAENKLTPQDLEGGTFTITNGGVYGSLLSTPIVNPPQSGVLGMHAIQDRPVARNGQVVIRPMMYVALTYDHRLIDGREAVTFLRHIKECVEDPARMLLEV